MRDIALFLIAIALIEISFQAAKIAAYLRIMAGI